nr:hypothetical protein HmN_000779200 [Hymenolepis microstoma]
MVLTCELAGFHLQQAYNCVDREDWEAYLLESRNILYNDDIISVIENSIESSEYFKVVVPSKTLSQSDQLAFYLTASLFEISVKNNGIAEPGDESQLSHLMSAPMPPVNLTTRNGNVADTYATSIVTGAGRKKNKPKKKFNPKKNKDSRLYKS